MVKHMVGEFGAAFCPFKFQLSWKEIFIKQKNEGRHLPSNNCCIRIKFSRLAFLPCLVNQVLQAYFQPRS